MQHQAPELEALLPTVVAGRTLASWSVRGASYFGLGGPVPADDLAEIAAELASDGLQLDDVAMAVAGRSSVQADRPYMVTAIRFNGVPAGTYPLSAGIDHADAGAWHDEILGGKSVEVGAEAMFDQTDHLRGRPYVYNSGDVRYIVGTDDAAWAAEVFSMLP